jgi:primosomal protein N' (replication factor Y) (superfamily II helicase)
VVVGTTMLLSQAAPPNLAVIAITFADTLLSLSDFRATERYHALLRKLLEWHPKTSPLLLIQTYQAENPALTSILEGFDAAHYPALELKSRRLLGYPPFVQLAQIIISAKDPQKAQQQALELAAQMLASGATQSELLGPAPSPIARLKGLYSYHLLLRAKDETRLEVLLGLLERSRGVRMRVDLNPRQFVGL